MAMNKENLELQCNRLSSSIKDENNRLKDGPHITGCCLFLNLTIRMSPNCLEVMEVYVCVHSHFMPC